MAERGLAVRFVNARDLERLRDPPRPEAAPG
jgi:hypothetical protein